VNKFSILSHIKTNTPTNSFSTVNQIFVPKNQCFDKKIKNIFRIRLIYLIYYFAFVKVQSFSFFLPVDRFDRNLPNVKSLLAKIFEGISVKKV
jgi:hypothetical protein